MILLHKYKIEQWVELYTRKRRFCSLLNFCAVRLSSVLTYDYRQVMSLMLAQ